MRWVARQTSPFPSLTTKPTYHVRIIEWPDLERMRPPCLAASLDGQQHVGVPPDER